MIRIIAILVVIGLGLWLSFVLIIKLVGVILIVTVMALIGALLWGALVPIRIFLAPDQADVEVASPERVVAGEFFGLAKPRGNGAAYGWDPAWPNYAPTQFAFDCAAVRSRSMNLIGGFLGLAMAPFVFLSDHKVIGFLIVPLCAAFWSLPTLAVAAGFVVSYWGWLACISLVMRIVVLVQSGLSRIEVLAEVSTLKRRNMTMTCLYCHRCADTPSYRCSGCGAVHHDIHPGRLGIGSRICRCGTSLPLTVRRASAVLTPVCPFCQKDLPKGTGSRRVVPVPVFGSVGAGKTYFLSTAALQIDRTAKEQGQGLSPLTPASEQFLRTTEANAKRHQPPAKTARVTLPETLVFRLDGPEPFELQFKDAAGENFVAAEEARGLAYLDNSRILVFVLDPLVLDGVRGHLSASPVGGWAQVAQGSWSVAYGSVVDRLRADGFDVASRQLVIVVTKADVVHEVRSVKPVPTTSDEIRSWLLEHDGDAVVRRAEMDFREVHYFAVDSSHPEDRGGGHSPLAVIDWIAREIGAAVMSEPSATCIAPGAGHANDDKESA